MNTFKCLVLILFVQPFALTAISGAIGDDGIGKRHDTIIYQASPCNPKRSECK
jgi:hypothetical protein